MSAPAHAIEFNAPQSVTTISANARVDYILRFSKHAVLVVDQDANVYSQVASQFLGSLANDHNGAFIAISPKLNDIQIRCRIVEQLFRETLFDPEQSLAVSIINLAKQEKHAIDIVIEHAQYLSLQILHELCQLTEVAKNANYVINVLMVGTPLTGTLLANHKTLFNKKISILSAQTGQLLALNAKVFKVSRPFFKFTLFTKWLMIFVTFIVSLALTGFWLFQQDVFSLKTKLGLQGAILNATNFISTKNNEPLYIPAESADLFLALTSPELLLQKDQLSAVEVPANPTDIMGAIITLESDHQMLKTMKPTKRVKRFSSFLDEKTPSVNNVEVTNIVNVEPSTIIQNTITASQVPPETSVTKPLVEIIIKQTSDTNKNTSAIENLSVEVDYYVEAKTGFVIQIAGFTRLTVYQKFIPDFEKIKVKHYHRLLNEQAMLVITSEVYPTRFSAEQAIALLPSAIAAHKPWVKSVEAINNEINAYQRSQ
jgi:DamX protein